MCNDPLLINSLYYLIYLFLGTSSSLSNWSLRFLSITFPPDSVSSYFTLSPLPLTFTLCSSHVNRRAPGGSPPLHGTCLLPIPPCVEPLRPPGGARVEQQEIRYRCGSFFFTHRSVSRVQALGELTCVRALCALG